MKRILFVLLLVAATAHAQEVRGPFDIGISPLTHSANYFAEIGPDTVEFLSLSGVNGVFYWAYSQLAESVIVQPTEVFPLPEDWYSFMKGPVKTSDGWAMLEYQFKEFSEFDYGYNRLVMHYGHSGQFNSVILDSGRTHEYWIDGFSRSTSDFSIIPRLDGGFYLTRGHSFAELDSTGEWAMRYEREIREYLHPDLEPIFRNQDCDGGVLSGPADTLLFIDSSIPFGNEIGGCIATLDTHVVLPVWNDCVIQMYDMMFTPERGVRLLTGYSPILQLKQLTFDGRCEQITQVEAVAEKIVSHRDWGYALITSDSPQLMIGQLDQDGQLIRQPTAVLSGSRDFQDVQIAENGDICMIWSEFVYPYGFVTRLLIVPWYAVLDVPEAETPVIPNNLTLSSYPNPFNSAVTIKYDLPQAGHAKLTAYDLQGRVVATLFDDFAPAGSAELHWSPENLASGVYFISLEAPFAHATHKILYLK